MDRLNTTLLFTPENGLDRLDQKGVDRLDQKGVDRLNSKGLDRLRTSLTVRTVCICQACLFESLVGVLLDHTLPTKRRRN